MAKNVINGIFRQIFSIVVPHGHSKRNLCFFHHVDHLLPSFHSRFIRYNISSENHNIRFFLFQYLQNGFGILFRFFRVRLPMYISELSYSQLSLLETKWHSHLLRVIGKNQVINQSTCIRCASKVHQNDTTRLLQTLSLLGEHWIHNVRESSRSCHRKRRSTRKADVPTVLLALMLHGRLHVLPSDASFVSRLLTTRVAIFIFHGYESFISLHILQCHPTSGIIVPTVALGTWVFLQDTVTMHEKNLASRLAQCQVILEILQNVWSKSFVVQAGSCQTAISFGFSPLLLQRNKKHLGRIFL